VTTLTLEDLNRMANGFQQSKVLLLGVEFNVFDHLEHGPKSARELAEVEQATLRGMEILLDSLAAIGLLTKEGDRYANTSAASRYLCKQSPDSVAHIMGHRNQMFRSWAQLDETIREGKQTPEREKATLTDRKANRNFILGMAEVSKGRIWPVLDRLPLATCKLFVDLGGGPAQYVCAAAERFPDLEALLVDLPLTVEVAQEQIARRGLSDRVRTLVCDFYREKLLEFGAPADVVLISQVLHAEGPEENRDLLARVHGAIRPGGTLGIVENLVDETRTSPVVAAMFSVNMLAGTKRGRTYTAREISSWLEEAGFHPSPAEPVADRAWMIVATKP